MKLPWQGLLAQRAGLTVLEVSISIGAFGVIGYGLISVMDFGRRSQQTVVAIADNNSDRQDATAQLVRELSSSSDARISLDELPGGNTTLTFQQPIDVDGAAVWGVSDPRLALGYDEDETFEDWSLRYTVQTEFKNPVGGYEHLSQSHANIQMPGAGVRTLLRQVLNAENEIVSSETVLTNLRGDAEKPGFHVQRVGDVWEIRIATLASSNNEPSLDTVIHVATRN
jgi:hypothetical protein